MIRQHTVTSSYSDEAKHRTCPAIPSAKIVMPTRVTTYPPHANLPHGYGLTAAAASDKENDVTTVVRRKSPPPTQHHPSYLPHAFPPYGYPPPPTQHHNSYLPHAFPPPPPTQHHNSYLPHAFPPYGYPPHRFGYGYSDGYGIPTQYHPPYPPQSQHRRAPLAQKKTAATTVIEATGTKRSYGGGVDCNNAKKKRKVKGTKGYYKNPSGTFRVQIRRFGKDMNFGTYPNEQEAKLACAIAKNKLELSKKVQHELTPIDKKVLQSIRTEVKTIIKAATLEEKELLIATYRLSASVDDETAEEQVVSDNDEFSLFDLSIENDTVIENDIDDDGAPPPTKPPPTPHVVSAQVGGESQVASSPPSASPPLVDLINIVDFFKMRLASFQDEMSAKDYRNFCLVVVEGCDTITTTDNKLSSGFSKYDQDSCTFLKKVQKKSTAFMEVVRNHCKPLHAILTILQPHLLCVFPLLLRGELRMHADRKTNYGNLTRNILNPRR